MTLCCTAKAPKQQAVDRERHPQGGLRDGVDGLGHPEVTDEADGVQEAGEEDGVAHYAVDEHGNALEHGIVSSIGGSSGARRGLSRARPGWPGARSLLRHSGPSGQSGRGGSSWVCRCEFMTVLRASVTAGDLTRALLLGSPGSGRPRPGCRTVWRARVSGRRSAGMGFVNGWFQAGAEGVADSALRFSLLSAWLGDARPAHASRPPRLCAAGATSPRPPRNLLSKGRQDGNTRLLAPKRG